MIHTSIMSEHPISRWGIERALERAPDIGIVVTAAVATCNAVASDVLVLVADLPSLDFIARAAETTRVLIIGGSRRPADVETWLGTGARGYLHKSAEAEVIIDAVRAVASGKTVRPRFFDRKSANGRPALSPRETQVLQLIGMGYTHDQAARRMGVSRNTVDTYVKRVRGKLGAGNKAYLARAALLGGPSSSGR
jgi:DNA-binding NarL/FixJ family response regulator